MFWCIGDRIRHLVFPGFLLVALVMAIYVPFSLLHPMGQNQSSLSGRPTLRSDTATSPQRIDLDGIVTIAFGNYVRTRLVDGLVRSLEAVDRSNYAFPPIYLLTDAPQCFAHLENKTSAMKVHVIEATIPQMDAANEKMVIKSFKTRMFEYLPSDQVHQVLYMDVDIRVTASFPHWLASQAHELASNPANEVVMGIAAERSYIDVDTNAGTLWLHRNRSALCL